MLSRTTAAEQRTVNPPYWGLYMDSVPLYYPSSTVHPSLNSLAELAKEEQDLTTLDNPRQTPDHLESTSQSYSNCLDTSPAPQTARESRLKPCSPLPFAVPSYPPRPPTQFDSNSYEAQSDQSYSFGTPSYTAASWNSDYSPSSRGYSPPPLLASPSQRNELDSFEIQAQQLSLNSEEGNQVEEEMVPLTDFEESLATNEGGGGGMEGQVMEEQRGGGQQEREMTLTMPSVPRRVGSQGGGINSNSNPATGGGGSQRPYAYTRSSSGFGSFLNYANSPTDRTRPATPAYSATRSTVFDPTPSGSGSGGGGSVNLSTDQTPNTSAGTFVPPMNTATSSSSNTPSLAKLEIPMAPMVSLTGPTPETAKPRPKGRGTLELERVLGLWAAKTPVSFPRRSSSENVRSLTHLGNPTRPQASLVSLHSLRSVLPHLYLLPHPLHHRINPSSLKVSFLPNPNLSSLLNRPTLHPRDLTTTKEPRLRTTLHSQVVILDSRNSLLPTLPLPIRR